MNQIPGILLFFLGGGLGAGVLWLLFRERLATREVTARSEFESERAGLLERVQNYESQTIALKTELAETRSQLQSQSELRSAAEEKNSRIPDLENTLRQKEVVLEELRQKSSHLQSTLASRETELSKERLAAGEKLALFSDAQQKLADAFKALSSEALRHNNQSFLDLARATLGSFQESAKGDLDKRQQAINELLKPVRESLEKFDTKVNTIETHREGAYKGLTEQVQSLLLTQERLRGETANLVQALRRPVVRGRWGEMQLKRVVEMAGMLEHCHFELQASTDTEQGRLRPDMVVKFSTGKSIVVDAKAPLEAYLSAIELADDDARKLKMQDHAAQIRTHIAGLSRKAYWEQFQPAPEFVVLFLPAESFYSAALEADPSLIELAFDQKVVLATPTTLIAILRAAAHGWHQEALAQNAQEICQLGRDLYSRLAVMTDHWIKLGRNLNSAVSSYNEAIGSLESRVLPAARKFKELKAAVGNAEIADTTRIDQTARQLQNELTTPLLGDSTTAGT